MDLRVTISGSGRVSSASAVDAGAAESCIVQKLRAIAFPAFRGDEQSFVIPYELGGTSQVSAEPSETAHGSPKDAPYPTASTASKMDCEKICDQFMLAFPEGRLGRDVVRWRCKRRCGAGDRAFAVCAWKVKTSDDAVSCTALTANR